MNTKNYPLTLSWLGLMLAFGLLSVMLISLNLEPVKSVLILDSAMFYISIPFSIISFAIEYSIKH